MSVGQSQMSSISTLIEASSSAAVLLGFFMWYLAAGTIVGSEMPNDDGARRSNLNNFLMALFDPGVFLRSVFARARRGACPCSPGGRFCALQPDPTSAALPDPAMARGRSWPRQP